MVLVGWGVGQVVMVVVKGVMVERAGWAGLALAEMVVGEAAGKGVQVDLKETKTINGMQAGNVCNVMQGGMKCRRTA